MPGARRSLAERAECLGLEAFQGGQEPRMPLARGVSRRGEAGCLGPEALPGGEGGMPRARGVPGKAAAANASGQRHFQAVLKACPSGGERGAGD